MNRSRTRRIGRQFRTSVKGFVILVELSLQHSQSVELGEQAAGSFADRADRIVGMQLLPGPEIFLSASEVEIVESGKAMVERGNHGGSRVTFGIRRQA